MSARQPFTRTHHLPGRDLRVGDVIDTWFGTQRIVSLQPYTGRYRHDILAGARIARFAPSSLSMTIEAGAWFDVIRHVLRANELGDPAFS